MPAVGKLVGGGHLVFVLVASCRQRLLAAPQALPERVAPLALFDHRCLGHRVVQPPKVVGCDLGAGGIQPLCGQRLAERLGADFGFRSLSGPIEGDWPYLWIDVTYVKVREACRIVSNGMDAPIR